VCTITECFVASIARSPYKISPERHWEHSLGNDCRIVRRAGQSKRHEFMNFSQVSTRGRRHWKSRYLPQKAPLFGLRFDLSVRLEECRAVITTCRFCHVTVRTTCALHLISAAEVSQQCMRKTRLFRSRRRNRKQRIEGETDESHNDQSLILNADIDECQLIFVQ
jgi:hypothetical protein